MGSGFGDRYGITQFAEHNFSNWTFRVDVLLRKNVVQSCVTEKIPKELINKQFLIMIAECQQKMCSGSSFKVCVEW